MKLSLRCDAETALRTIEEFFRTRELKFEKRVYYTRIGLRKVEYELEGGKVVVVVYLNGVDVKIPRNLKDLGQILSVYEVRGEEEIKKKDHHDLKLDLQIYEGKLKVAKRGIVIRSIILLFVIFLANPHLNAGMIVLLLFLMLAFPEARSRFSLAEPTEWAIPLLLPYYAKKIREVKERLSSR